MPLILDIRVLPAPDAYLDACKAWHVTPCTVYLLIRHLTAVSLKDAGLGTRGIQALSQSLFENRTITDLDLSGNFIEHECGEWMGEMLRRNSTLTKLNLSRNRLSTGSQAVAQGLTDNHTLKTLVLRGN